MSDLISHDLNPFTRCHARPRSQQLSFVSLGLLLRMWVKRSPQEIAVLELRTRRQRFNPLGPAVLAILLVGLVVITDRSFPPSARYLSRLPFFLVLSIGFFYVSRVLLGTYFVPPRFSPPSVSVGFCASCNRPETPTTEGICHCGGKLEPLDHWRWVEDPVQT